MSAKPETGKQTADFKVAMVIEHLSHYRLGVYKFLEGHGEAFSFSFYGGLKEHQGIPPIPIDSLKRVQNVDVLRVGPFRWQKSVLHLAWQKEYDGLIVLGDMLVLSSWVLALVARARGKKVLFWTMGWDKPEPMFRWKIRKTFYGLSHVLLLYGQEGRKLALQYGVPDSKIVVVGNSIYSRSEIESTPPKEFSNGVKSICVGAVARITKDKRFDLLVTALALLRAKGTDATARLVGAGDEISELSAQAAELGVPIEFLSPIYSDESLSRYYRTVDLTVIPVFAGLPVVQSMAFGVPVMTGSDFTMRRPETDAIVHGRTGFFVESGSSDSLVEGILAFLDLSESERAGISAQAKSEVLDRWTVESQGEKILDGLRLASGGSIH